MSEERNISLILKQPEDESETVTISFGSIFRQMKRYLLVWIVLAAVLAMLTTSFVFLFSGRIVTSSITALVSFNYSGIESGKAPDGSTFDVNKIKSPNVIENALDDVGESSSLSENIRSNISIKGIIPDLSLIHI